MAVELSTLIGLDLLAGVDEADLGSLAGQLVHRDLDAGETLIEQDGEAARFALVVAGDLVVTRREHGRDEQLAVVGPGSIVGELALLRGRPRVATVAARTPAQVLTGDRDALIALLELEPVAERLRGLVSRRLAEDASWVRIAGKDGRHLALRPLRPDDRDALKAGIDAMSDESLYRRFFTGGRPSENIVDHLLDVDQLVHFAWVVADADGLEEAELHGRPGLGVARYHRLADDPTTAEAAFAVVDGQQGRGLGTLLVGALAAAAGAAGIERLRCEVLADNRPMRAVLDKADASWARVEQGVVVTDVEVAKARSLLDPESVARLERSVREVVTAAGLTLAHRVE